MHFGTNDTPFNPTFETNTVILVEGEINTPRVSHFDPNRNEDNICINLDLLEKAKKKSQYTSNSKTKVSGQYYNKIIRHRQFKEGDSILCNY